MDDDAPVRGSVVYLDHGETLRFRSAWNVTGTSGIIEQQFDFRAARQGFDTHLRLRPAERTGNAAQIEPLGQHARLSFIGRRLSCHALSTLPRLL